jgi:hypothetical protein
VRRFSCHNASCARAIFTERLPQLAQPRAQMTTRLRETLCLLGFATCARYDCSSGPTTWHERVGLDGLAPAASGCSHPT